MNRDICDLFCKNHDDYKEKNYSLADTANDIYEQLKEKYSDIDITRNEISRFLMALHGWIRFA